MPTDNRLRRTTYYLKPMTEPPLSAIELLVQEIFDDVVEQLELADVSRLCRCSKRLRQRLQPVLFKPEDRRNQAMRWACKNGNNHALRVAVSYGADISYVTAKSKGGTVKVPTLYLAARRRRVDGCDSFSTFELLLQLGARVDDPDIGTGTLPSLVRCLCLPANHDMLEAFLKAGLAAQLSLELRSQMLVEALRIPDGPWEAPGAPTETPSLDVVRILVDSGADPNTAIFWDKHGKRTVSPLATALVLRRWDLFELYLARGADISGARDKQPVLFPWIPAHVPIVAATFVMAKTKGDRRAELVQRCLDAGADVNVAVVARDTSPQMNIVLRLVTPLLVFVEGVEFESCRNLAEVRDELAREAGCGLQYLLDKGASAGAPYEIPPEYSTWMHLRANGRIALPNTNWKLQRSRKPLQTILRNWQLGNTLAIPSVLSATKQLIRLNSTDAAGILASCDVLERGNAQKLLDILDGGAASK